MVKGSSPKRKCGGRSGEELEAASAEAPGNAAGAARDFRGRRRRRGRVARSDAGRGRGERPARSEIRSERRQRNSQRITAADITQRTCAVRRAPSRAANHATNRVTNHITNQGATASAAATVWDAAGRTRDSSGPRRPPLVRPRLRLRAASGISADRASRRIDLEVPATGAQNAALAGGDCGGGRLHPLGRRAGVRLHRCEFPGR